MQLLLWRLSISLYPYTTLFRSEQRVCPDECSSFRSGTFPVSAEPRMGATAWWFYPDVPPQASMVHALRAPLDRKSTRLNSSHLVISYAVFCLKKKVSIIGWGSH